MKQLCLVVIFLCVSGCSYLGIEPPEFNTKDMSSTSLGTATGAVVGGGVGTVIGAQVGSPAGGLAVGAATGALAGAAIGRALDIQEEKTEETQAQLAQQKTEIASQTRTLNQMRNQAGDGVSLGNTNFAPQPTLAPTYNTQPQAFAANRPSVAKVTGRIAPNSFNVSSRKLSQGLSQGRASLGEVRSVESENYQTVTADPVGTTYVEPGVKRVTPAPIVAATPAPTLNTKAETVTTTDMLATTTLPAANTMPPAKKTEVVAEKVTALEPAAVASAPAPKTSPVASLETTGDDCTQAQQEMKRAQSSNSKADKLFYMRRAVRLCGTNAEYHIELGKIYSEIGRTEDAVAQFSQAVDIEPSNQVALNELKKIDSAAN
ncbi:tetratricopeptide repeat protein [bacterium]|nr:tetratricopeptide repeat protein [bacterium]